MTKNDFVNFNTANLDYDAIVEDLRNFLKYQKEFSDYDFTGSALTTLLNVLAYNTHYNNVYDNFALNESFLDSSVKRSSVVSHANLIGYIPRSAKSSKAIVDITVYDPESFDDNSVKYLPAYTQFTTTIDDVVYNFYNTESIVFTKNGSYYNIYNLKLVQGTLYHIEKAYTGDSRQKFVLEQPNVDTDSIEVAVWHGTIRENYRLAQNIIEIDENSKVYFMSLNGNDRYQIQFGNASMGYSLSNEDIVDISYMACDGTKTNGAKNFVLNSSPTSFGFSANSHITTKCVERSSGGQYPEDTESIRMLAPLLYTTQNRCVTSLDYQTTILSLFDNAKKVKVWGGQENDPPQYGKVFISIIPKDGLVLTEIEKESIREFLDQRKVETTLIEFVEPQILKVIIDSTVYFDGLRTRKSKEDIETAVRGTILKYGEDVLDDFGQILKYSQLSKAIDNTGDIFAIENNSTRIRLSSTITPIYNLETSYYLNLNNAIYKPNVASGCISSTGFGCSKYPNKICYIDDDPVTSVLRMYYLDDNNRKVVLESVGTVNYTDGTIVINNLNVTHLYGAEWKFVFNPDSNDVITKHNQFAVIATEDLTVTALKSNDKYVQVSSK